MTVHRMVVESDYGSEILFTCPDCSRRLVLRRGGGLTILDRGDFEARHSGGLGPPGSVYTYLEQ